MFHPSNNTHPETRTPQQKRRMLWTPQMKILFEEAINHLGMEKATPKPILEVRSSLDECKTLVIQSFFVFSSVGVRSRTG